MMQRFFFNSSRIPCYEQDNFIFKEKKKKLVENPSDGYAKNGNTTTISNALSIITGKFSMNMKQCQIGC
jgi:hypothetical protein